MNMGLSRRRIIGLLMQFQALLTLSLGGAVFTTAIAASVPNFDRQVEIALVNEVTTAEYIEKLFGLIEVPVVVSDQVVGDVVGAFSGPADQLFSELAGAIPVTVYYDGTRAYVYPAKNVTRSFVGVPEKVSLQVVKQVANLDLADNLNKVSLADKGLWVRGTDRFFEQVDELKNAALKSDKTYQPQVVHKIFKVKYGYAADYPMKIGGEDYLIRGIVNTLIAMQSGSTSLPPPVIRQQKQSNTEEGESSNERLQMVKDGGGDTTNSTMVEGDARAPLQYAGQGSQGLSNVLIIADEANNSIIIRDRADRMAGYERLISMLDVKPEKVQIEATIIDLYTDRLRDLGINWRLMDKNNDILFGDGTPADRLLKPGTEITPSGEGGMVSMTLGLGNGVEYIARIHALETQGAARIVSKPSVLTLHNIEAKLNTTTSYPVRLEGEQVELAMINVSTMLLVRPNVVEDGATKQIKMNILVEDGSASAAEVENLPVVERSQVRTEIIVDAGDSILLGGQVREIRSNKVSKVPFLSSIPFLGKLFINNSRSTIRTERMFLITPRLVGQDTSGKRHVGEPILEGSETDIIGTSHLSLLDTNAGLALRDLGAPLEQPLPQETISNGLTIPKPKPVPGEVARVTTSRPSLLLENAEDWQALPEPGPATLQVETLLLVKDIGQESETSHIAPATAGGTGLEQWQDIN
ncbi:MAG: type III secretion system outer membrane ring subunit SctC [Granulosicoccus sp.]